MNGVKGADELGLQKIVSDAYTSFSVLGLCLVFIVGGLIIILSYSIEPLAFWIEKRCSRGSLPAQMEWIANETLQLQRLAHEELGAGAWSGAANAVPVTKAGETLATLDTTDAYHPRLDSSS